MKKIFFVLVLGILSWTASSCNHNETTSQSKMYLHIQSDFDNDQVKIDVDGQEVYNNIVTTNHLLGLADIDSTLQTNGHHEIKITVNNTYTFTEMYHLDHTVYLGIQQSAANDISIMYSDEQFLYD